jgi:Domain of unknown function (DUF4112)
MAKAIVPEVLEPDERLPADLRALRRFANLMDRALPIPGTHRRFGLDPALGLIPVVGDVVSAFLSLWIIFGALRHRVPLLKVARMVAAVLLDLLIGAIPVVGDFFDVIFTENVDNVELLVRHRDRSRPTRSWKAITFGILTTVFAIAIVSVALLVWTIWIVTSWRLHS